MAMVNSLLLDLGLCVVRAYAGQRCFGHTTFDRAWARLDDRIRSISTCQPNVVIGLEHSQLPYRSTVICIWCPSPQAMALRILVTLLAFVAARSDDIEAAMATDGTCEAGGDCSLELNQLRGIKVHYLEALEDEEEESAQAEEEAELEGGGCTDAADLGVWKGGGRRSFDAALNHCGRSCAAGFPCTKDRLPPKV